MRVRMKVSLSGSRNGVSWPARGEEVVLPDGEAADLCRSGLAEPVAEPEKNTETATPPAAEKRVTRKRAPSKPKEA
jgi:hypothetical protein